MKTIKKHFKFVAITLSMFILLQGCTVYKSAPVTLEEAYKSQTKVKVKNKDNQALKFDRVTINNGTYYGAKEIGNIMTQIPLEKEHINKTQIKNKPL